MRKKNSFVSGEGDMQNVSSSFLTIKKKEHIDTIKVSKNSSGLAIFPSLWDQKKPRISV